jgi:hypothetical protein
VASWLGARWDGEEDFTVRYCGEEVEGTGIVLSRILRVG